MSDLTDKQAAFVDEYLVDLNAAAAAKRAGYSEKTARHIGHENLTKPNVKAAIAKRRKEQQERVEINADMVVEGLLFEAKLPDEAGGNTNARIQAWKALGKHLGLFVDKVENSGTQRIIVEYVEAD